MRIVDEMTKLGARRPLWETKQGVVSLTLYRAPVVPPEIQLQRRQLAFLAAVRSPHRFHLSAYALKAKVSERQARRDLSQMQALGFIEQIGRGPSTEYLRTKKTLVR